MIAIDHLHLNSLTDSNLFLRALWAILRTRFGKLNWQYIPRKIGSEQRIRFGWMSLGDTAPVSIEVGICYGKVGLIKSIEFTPMDINDATHFGIENAIRESVNNALRVRNTPKDYQFFIQTATIPSVPLAYYQGRNWHSGPLSNGNTEISIIVKAFDTADSKHEFAVRLGLILDTLSCLTNVVFEISSSTEGQATASSKCVNQFLRYDDWLDDFPVEDDHLRLSAKQIQFCEDLIDDLVEDRLNRAANIFHKALTMNAKFPEGYDVAMALFISALEAVDVPLKKPETCQECNQPKYKISQRIVDLAIRHLGLGVEKIFKESYNRRSKYLHTGKVLAHQPMALNAIPQLDPNGIHGCAMPSAVSNPKNILEFTSFIIRQEILLNKGKTR